MRSKIDRRLEALDDVDVYFRNRGLSNPEKADFWKQIRATDSPEEILEMARLYVLGKLFRG